MPIAERPWPQTSRVLQRFTQFDQMIDLTGTDPLAAVRESGGASMAQARNTCLRCLLHRECQNWLNQTDGPTDPPAFCPNADALRDWARNTR